eukprot:TRINITY_DN6406_c0_g1_i1.p1 TRINITY_DN6406_c0_g1~~TRINITY_DN6406_c0_g1_i1.p1  ORF type:complete len:216 (-),score=15.82 TRINITY_DN6406_c0_g1_i1:58-705(-)
MSSKRCPKCNHKNESGWKFCSNCAYKNDVQRASCSYHFVVMGHGGVGKSAVTIQFVNRHFESKYDPTIEDRYQKVIDHKNVPCFLEILDTAGQETFSAMRELYMRNGEGFVLVYSITNRSSFDEIVTIRNGILRHTENIPIVIVGNKCDLESRREISTSEGRELSKNLGCPFLETSAKKDINIQEIFHTLIQEVWDKGGGPPSSSSKSSGICSVL